MVRLFSLILLLLCVIPVPVIAGPAQRDAEFNIEIDEIFPDLVVIRRDLHMNPELSNQEKRTGQIVAEKLQSYGLEVKTGVAGNGVVGILKGDKPGGVVAVRADMDALPIQETGEVPYKSKTPGVMHACGHDVHTTIALGVAELLSKNRDQVSGTVKFLFQPAEEGMGPEYEGDWGAKLMIREGALQNPRPSAVFGLHSTPIDSNDDTALEAGQVQFIEGPASANSDSFEIKIRGKMAHGASPQRGVDSIVVASAAVLQLQTIRSRRIDTREPLVITIGSFHGGNRRNIIAEEVQMSGTVRTYSESIQDQAIKMMHQTLKGVTEIYGASYELIYKKGYPSIIRQSASRNRLSRPVKL